MSSQTIVVNDTIVDYLLAHEPQESETAKALREATEPMPMAVMQISPIQGALMAWFVKLIGAKRTIEVGTFTGYSALVVAEALPDDGKLVACDVSETWTAMAREYWEQAGVHRKIHLHLRPAVETLDELIANGEAASYDFAFIDADKPNYDAYYERCLQLLRTGGVVGVDNVLWNGSVAYQTVVDESTVAIRALNDKIANDFRVAAVMLPVGDGLTLARKL